jgi:UDP-N-acetylmuramoyl-tripeptide--D-alanyl-D-alanine ligase
MKSALKVLDMSECTGKKIAILGDMYELGEDSKKEHFGVGVFARNLAIDTIVAIGEDAAEIADGASGGEIQAVYFKTKDEFISVINRYVTEEDMILVKGSRGMKMELVVEELKKI